MNPALALALGGAADAALMSAAISACKRCGIRKKILTPCSGVVLSACWLVQSVFSTRTNSFWESALVLVLVGCLAVSAVTDLAAGYIFDSVTLSGLVAASLIGMIDGRFAPIAGGAFLVSGAILALHAASRGRGIGLGDAKLAACVGALLGPRNGLRSLGFAFVLGGTYAAVLLLSRRARGKETVPFAPYLAAGAFIELALQSA
ncbi:MAG TPA: A24 family peptidase [Candidatus Rubrimentiphilum sp.]|nr:A24 family peptidase [Candidatus Rubrimentiphilum sp.]